MSENKEKKCPTCGGKAHDFKYEEPLGCVPPRDVLEFGNFVVIDKAYREALLEEYPDYNAEEIVGSFLGYNPYFKSQEDWINSQEVEEKDEDDEEANLN